MGSDKSCTQNLISSAVGGKVSTEDFSPLSVSSLDLVVPRKILSLYCPVISGRKTAHRIFDCCNVIQGIDVVSVFRRIGLLVFYFFPTFVQNVTRGAGKIC